MKNSLFIKFCMYILPCSLIFLLGNPVYSQTASSDKGEFLYPANKEKVFDETVDEFYQALRDRKFPVHHELDRKDGQNHRQIDTLLFKDMPDASASFRSKVLFKDVEKYIYITWDGNIHTTYPSVESNSHQTVSPNRQVYFFFSFKDTEKEFRGRYAIYDVETKKGLYGGGTYIPKYPTYKKHLK
ncbi:hypothetical protein M3181_23130 [Mesobacillus maritimus]|uniref:hypothetical protein n=1 Tax=Mesobacillus maritimus TaxID=1643336 RepID=UPI00203D46A4|nr:hypothetical protein [Mesobacillus maritimus]MCM3671854.1 hypothetical protein [Mesobacillus maritimus]